MDFIYIGKIVGTHGIKGEIRIISNFDKKEKIFVIDKPVYIGNEKHKEIINSYRKHKNYDMITLKGIYDINEVLKYKGQKIYALRSDLDIENDYVLDDLLGMKIVSNNEDYGIVEDIFDNNGNTLLKILFDKNYYIPYNKRYIKSVDLKNKSIEVDSVKDLILWDLIF